MLRPNTATLTTSAPASAPHGSGEQAETPASSNGVSRKDAARMALSAMPW